MGPDLERVGTMSTKKELLRQIRDAVMQAGLSVAGIVVLIVFVGLMYGTLESAKKVTGQLDEQMQITLGLMQEMSASLNTTESFLGYLSVLPGMVDHMDNMKTNIAISTDAMGCSAIFGGGSKPECQA